MLGAIPERIIAHSLFRTRRDLVKNLLKPEVAIDLVEQLGVGHALVEDLFFGAKDVAVVLHKATYPHDAVQRTGGFVAMAVTKLTIAKRQIAIAAQRRVVHLHMPRAIHRLHRIVAIF